jgi:hypothetical protein
MREETDRWEQARVLASLARECFAEAYDLSCQLSSPPENYLPFHRAVPDVELEARLHY